MTKSDDKKVPALRFKGFTDDWEQRKFESLIYPEKIKNKNNLQLRAYSISNKNGFIAQTDQFGKDNTYSKADKKTNYIVNPGAFAYNPARINIGSIGYQNLATPVLVSSLYEVFKTNSQIKDLFLIYWFKTDKFFNQIKKYEEGGVRQYYFLDKLLFSEIIIPKDVREQQKISKILKKLDYLISLQQRKLRYLSAIKKSLLQNMLVDNDLRPELRFTKFSGNWEQHKISEMAKRLDNLRIPVTASNRKKGDIPYYGANGIQDYVEGFTHKGENILIAEDGANNLDNYPIRLVKGKIWVNNHAHVLKAYKNCTDIQFLEFELKKLNIYKYLVGGSRLKLNADILMNISIKSPTLKEQKKIGFMLSLLEENTIFQQRKLNKLELLNQFFLQHMFI